MRYLLLLLILIFCVISCEQFNDLETLKDIIIKNVEEKFFNKVRFLEDETSDKLSVGIPCKVCVYSFYFVQKVLNTRLSKYIISLIIDIGCRFGFSKDICAHTENYFGDEILNGLISRIGNPGYICHSLKICPNSDYYFELNPDDYANKILADKPANTTKIQPSSRNSSDIVQFVQISDVHIDNKYTEGSNGNCDDFQICCRNNSGIPKNASDVAGTWGFLGRCDIPVRTLNVSLDYIFSNVKPNFVLWTGDNPSHEYLNMEQNEGLKATITASKIIKTKFPGIKVYPTLGNHEKVPLDQFDFFHMSEENNFLKTIGDEWKDWIGEDAYQSFVNYGYYTTLHNDTKLRIISINSYLWDNFNFFLLNNPTNPLNQLEWMENTLRKAENNSEAVYIIGHIPPGSNYFNSEASRRYNVLIDRFSHIISGQFFGHSHSEEFKIIREYYNKDKIAGIVHTCGSITTHAYRNPGFRVYSMYEEDYLLKDYTYYFMNITKANLNGGNVKPIYEIGYNASKLFNLSYLNEFEKYEIAVNKIITDKLFLDTITSIYFGYGLPNVDLVPRKKEIVSNLKDDELGYFLWCRFKEDIFDNYIKCMGKRKTWDGFDSTMHIVEKISGKWHKRKDFIR